MKNTKKYETGFKTGRKLIKTNKEVIKTELI